MTEDKSPMDDARARAAFDPGYQFPPIVRVPEPLEVTMARIDAEADVAMEPCPSCGVLPVPLAGGRAFGINHLGWCPEGDVA